MNKILNISCLKNISLLKTIIETLTQISIVEPHSDDIDNRRVKQLYLKFNKKYLEIYTDLQKSVNSVIKIDECFFENYDYDFEDFDNLCIGLSLEILKKFFKNIGKNSDLNIFINYDTFGYFPDTINFQVNNMGMDMKFNIIQNTENIKIDSFENPLIITSSKQFSSLYKEIGSLKKKIKLSIDEEYLKLSCTTINISESWVQFKLIKNDDTIILPNLEIKSEYLKVLSKLSTFDDIYWYINDEILHLSSKLCDKNKEVIGNMIINIKLDTF